MDNTGQKVDYAGRTVDLLLLKTVLNVPAVSQRVGIDVTDVVGEPMIVSGIEKMVQRYAIAFINSLGSTKFMPNHGTNLIPAAASGRIYDMNSLEVEASEANLLAMRQLENADFGMETPDDERLVNSEVAGLEFIREKALARISVKLTSAAGKSFVYIIPVPVGVN